MDISNLLDGEELVALARIDVDKNELADALTKLKIAKSLQDYPVDLHSLLGRIFARLGLFQRAKAAYSMYIEKKPDAIHERFELGHVCRDMGDTRDALAHWAQVLDLSPAYPPALFFHSLTLLDDARHTEGVAGLERLLETVPPENIYASRAQEILAARRPGSRTVSNGPLGQQ